MQSNPMELIETNPVFSELGIGIRLNSRRREARGVPPTCVITHWKPTNGNVFTNVIHPNNNQNSVSQRLQLIFELRYWVSILAATKWHLLKVCSPQYAAQAVTNRNVIGVLLLGQGWNCSSVITLLSSHPTQW